METICEFKQTFWNFFPIHQTKIYTCCIDGRNSNLQIQFNAQHLNGLDDDKVLGLSVNNCQFSKIPDNFNEKFKNICYLSINCCDLKEISNEDLKCFPNLFFLNLSENEIEFLPKNLFFGMTNLQYIFITFNKLLYIEPNIVDSFNPCINVVYNFSGEKKNNLKEELRNILFYSLAPSSSVKVAFDDKLNEIAELKATISKLQEKNVIAIESDRVKVLNETLDEINPFMNDIEAYLANDDLKDFTIILNNEKFKVHKMILAARSSVFAEIIKNNPEVEEIKLTDIPTNIFKKVLDFIYFDIIPNSKNDLIEIYDVAKKLKTKSLKNAIEKGLLKKLNNENVFDLFLFALKHKINDLKKISIVRNQEIFPEMNFKNDLTEQFEELRKFSEINRIMKDLSEKLT